MLIYIIIFIITAVIAFLQFNYPKKVSPVTFTLYVMAIGIFVGLGDMLGGYDRYIYCEVFTGLSKSVSAGEGIFNSIFIRFFAKEPLYGLINVIIGQITPNRYIFILLYSLLMYGVFGYSIYKNTNQPFFALLVFMSILFFFSFTYLRQILAVGVVWLAMPFYANRNLKKYLILIGVATLIHNSAAIMAVLYFIPLKKWPIERVLIMMTILLMFGLVGVGGVFDSVGHALGNQNVLDHVRHNYAGIRFEYIVESFIFLILLHNNYDSISEDEESLSYLNLYLTFCGILLLFCKSSDGGRVSWYGILGLSIMLSSFCENSQNRNLRVGMLVLFSLLYFRVLFAWEFNMCPYKTFLTPGHTGEEWIYYKYEYDKYYDQDKLYNL